MNVTSGTARHNKQHGRRKGSDADHPTARVGRDQREQGRLRWLGAGKGKEGERKGIGFRKPFRSQSVRKP